MPVRIQTADFDLSTEIAALHRSGAARSEAVDGAPVGAPVGAAVGAAVGAIVSFIGTVRDMNEGDQVATMELEHYPGMTEKALEAIVERAKQRWPILQALVIHRVGPLQALDQIVLVAVSAVHRGEAFAACEFIMDYLKTEAPFWKKEHTNAGARWLDARSVDDAALQKWVSP